MLNFLFIKSVSIYALLGIVMYYSAMSVPLSLSGRRKMPKGYILCIVLFGVISGLRWDVGVDHLGYLQSYRESLLGRADSREDFEKGYLLVKNIFAFFHFHYSLFFAFWAILQAYFVVQATRDEKYKVVPILLIIPLSWHYITWMNGIRQMVVACSFLWATKFIINKDFKKYLLWIIICSFIHKSVWFLLPVYFFNRIQGKWNNGIVQVLILFVCLILGSNPTWISLLNTLADPLTFLGFDRYASTLDFNTSADALKGFSFGPRMISMVGTYVFVILTHKRVCLYFNSVKYDLFYKLFVIGAYGHLLFINTSIFMRPVDYFTIFSLPVSAYALCFYKNTKQLVPFMFLLFICAIYVLTACYTESLVPEKMRNSFLYQFCFTHWDIVNHPIVRPR